MNIVCAQACEGKRIKYADDAERSAEYLRRALPLMSRQAAGLHPVSYAVWYEYVSGRNPQLNASIDARIGNGAVLDEQATLEVFRKHITEIDEEILRRVSEGIQKALAEMSRSVSRAGDDAGAYGRVLEQWSADLAASPGAVDMLLRHTRDMQASADKLKASLDESRRQIEELRREVVRARQDALSDGDKVLVAIARILTANVKGKDVAARYGGEEFVVLLPATRGEDARRVAENLRAEVARCRIRRIDRRESVGSVTISIGVASHRDGESARDFITRADAALYTAKNNGRNCVAMAALFGGEPFASARGQIGT